MNNNSKITKKKVKKTRASSGNGLVGSFLAYLQSAKSELFRVTWPTRSQATRSALIVLGFTFFMAFFFAIVDQLISMGYLKLSQFSSYVKTS